MVENAGAVEAGVLKGFADFAHLGIGTFAEDAGHAGAAGAVADEGVGEFEGCGGEVEGAETFAGAEVLVDNVLPCFVDKIVIKVFVPSPTNNPSRPVFKL